VEIFSQFTPMAEETRHIVRDRRLTADEIEHYRELRAKHDAELPDIKAVGRALRDRPRGLPLVDIIKALKEEREKLGLSLPDVSRRSGIDEDALSALENDPQSDPTINLVSRYAGAVGKKVELSLVP
jgi:DNA-binding XRE family transcriptional regulator